MKFFAGIVLGASIVISMLYEHFGMFCWLLFVSFVLTLSFNKQLWNEPDTKKGTTAANSRTRR